MIMLECKYRTLKKKKSPHKFNRRTRFYSTQSHNYDIQSSRNLGIKRAALNYLLCVFLFPSSSSTCCATRIMLFALFSSLVSICGERKQQNRKRKREREQCAAENNHQFHWRRLWQRRWCWCSCNSLASNECSWMCSYSIPRVHFSLFLFISLYFMC